MDIGSLSQQLRDKKKEHFVVDDLQMHCPSITLVHLLIVHMKDLLYV